CQAGEREELDVGGKHTEHAYPPEHVQRPDPRRPRCHRTAQRFGVLRSRGGVCGTPPVIHAVTHSPIPARAVTRLSAGARVTRPFPTRAVTRLSAGARVACPWR